jgi:hypothetical protein
MPPVKETAMVALVLVFCLQAAPASCTEERPFSDLSPQDCLRHGEQYAIEWLSQHPKWRLSRWRCEHNVPHQEPT